MRGRGATKNLLSPIGHLGRKIRQKRRKKKGERGRKKKVLDFFVPEGESYINKG